MAKLKKKGLGKKIIVVILLIAMVLSTFSMAFMVMFGD